MEIKVDGANVEQALKVLKRKLQREGLFGEIKRRAFYEKPSEKMKTKRRLAQKRRAKKNSRASR